MALSVRGVGSVYPRANGSWVTVINAVGNDGKPKRKSLYSKTEKEAERKLRMYCTGKNPELAQTRSKLSTREVFQTWLAYKRPRVKRSSYDRIESIVENHILPELGFVQFASVTSDLISAHLQKQADAGMSYSTIKKTREAINACCKFAVKRGIAEANYCEDIAMSKSVCKQPKDIRAFSKDEIAAFKTEAERCYSTGAKVYRYGALFILTLNTGIRLGEAAGLKIGDFDKEAHLLHIRRNISAVKKRDKQGGVLPGMEFIEQTPKTEAGGRVIPLNDTAYAALISLVGDRIDSQEYDRRKLVMFTTGTTTTTSAVNAGGLVSPPLGFDEVVRLIRTEAIQIISNSRIAGAMSGSMLMLQIQIPYGPASPLGAIDMSELQNTIIKNMVVKIEELAKQPGIDAATASIIKDAFIEMLRGSGAIS